MAKEIERKYLVDTKRINESLESALTLVNQEEIQTEDSDQKKDDFVEFLDTYHYKIRAANLLSLPV